LFVLASSYLIARLLLGSIFGGYWDLSWEFLTDLVAVTAVQLVTLELLWPSTSHQMAENDTVETRESEDSR
jgi:hypothetical protein